MLRIFIFGIFFALFPAKLMFAQGISANAKATNLIHIQSGKIGTALLGVQLHGNAGCSVKVRKTVSTISEFSFSSETVSAAVNFPVKNLQVSAQFSATAFHNINICNTAFFESAVIAAASGFVQIPLCRNAVLSTFLTAGQMDTNGGNVYGFKAVPEIPYFSLFGATLSFPKLTVLLQAGLFGISVCSEAESAIDSSGFQKEFLLLCGDRITFGKNSASYWSGVFYTDGNAAAQTQRGNASIFAEDRFFAVGTGAKFSFENKNFFLSAGLHFLYLPIGFASAEFAYDIKLIFYKLHKNFNFTFNDKGKHGLILPRFSGGIRLPKSGQIFIDKTFYIPFDFSNSSNSGTNVLPSCDVTQLLLTIIFSGLSIGIKI